MFAPFFVESHDIEALRIHTLVLIVMKYLIRLQMAIYLAKSHYGREKTFCCSHCKSKEYLKGAYREGNASFL